MLLSSGPGPSHVDEQLSNHQTQQPFSVLPLLTFQQHLALLPKSTIGPCLPEPSLPCPSCPADFSLTPRSHLQIPLESPTSDPASFSLPLSPSLPPHPFFFLFSSFFLFFLHVFKQSLWSMRSQPWAPALVSHWIFRPLIPRICGIAPNGCPLNIIPNTS